MSSFLVLTIVTLFGLAYGKSTGDVVGVPGFGLLTPPGGTLVRGVPRAMPINTMDKSPYYYFYRPRGLIGVQKPVEEGLVGSGPLVARMEEPMIPPREVPAATGVYRQYSNLGQYPDSLYSPYGYNGYPGYSSYDLPVAYGYPYYYGTTIGYGYGLPQLVGGAGAAPIVI